MGSRLVTWNLFFSASAYEREEPVDGLSLADLSALVEAFCLYDDLVVLGDPEYPPFLHRGSDFFDSLRESGVVKVYGENEINYDTVRELARQHITAFLGSIDSGVLERLLDQAFRLNTESDRREVQATMNAAIRLSAPSLIHTPTPDDVRGYLSQDQDPIWYRPFFVRVFMYFAVSEILKLPWVPDAARRPTIGTAMQAEQDLSMAVAKQLEESWETPTAFGNPAMRDRLSPLAAVVLGRCRGDRSRLPQALTDLRAEIRSTREHLKSIEAEDPDLFEQQLKLEARWDKALAELRRSYGPAGGLWNYQRGIPLLTPGADAIDNPCSISSWVSLFLSYPAEVARRWWRRRPFVQLHRLKKELPSTNALVRIAEDTFPTLSLD